MFQRTLSVFLIAVMALFVGCTTDSAVDDSAGADTGTNDTSDEDLDGGVDASEDCEPVFPGPDEVRDGRDVLVAAEAEDTVEVDGALEEGIYQRASAVEFDGDSVGSDNAVRAFAVWESNRLVFAFDVEDGDIDIDEESSINSNDGIELVLDVDDARGEVSDDDHHWLIRVDGEYHTELYAGAEEEPNTDIELDVASEITADGWSMEVAVDADAIDLEPADGERIGLLLANNDRDGGEWTMIPWIDDIEFKSPATYGGVYLAAASCEGDGGDGSQDAGHDDTGDGDTGDDTNGDPGDPCEEGGDFEPLPVSGPVPLGGGPDYENLVCEGDADAVVSTFDELETALGEANTGDVVFVDPDAEIDMGFDADLPVPPGVTLSGGRGCECRAGALLYTDEDVEVDYDHEQILQAQDQARVTGLRIRGMRTPGEWIDQDTMSHELDGRAIKVTGSDIEIDNNELWGFAHAGISAAGSTHVRHNHIHDMVRDGLGYGVTGGDGVLIEYNYFDWVRHAVASGGRKSYEARYNHMGEHAISHVYDMHQDGGETVLIHHNTVEAVDNMIKDKNVPAVTIRGTPSDTADIYNNWFFNPEEPRDQPIDSWTDEAIVQMHVTEWTNLEFWDNHYGSDDPGDCSIGAPREGCPAP